MPAPCWPIPWMPSCRYRRHQDSVCPCTWRSPAGSTQSLRHPHQVCKRSSWPCRCPPSHRMPSGTWTTATQRCSVKSRSTIVNICKGSGEKNAGRRLQRRQLHRSSLVNVGHLHRHGLPAHMAGPVSCLDHYLVYVVQGTGRGCPVPTLSGFSKLGDFTNANTPPAIVKSAASSPLRLHFIATPSGSTAVYVATETSPVLRVLNGGFLRQDGSTGQQEQHADGQKREKRKEWVCEAFAYKGQGYGRAAGQGAKKTASLRFLLCLFC